MNLNATSAEASVTTSLLVRAARGAKTYWSVLLGKADTKNNALCNFWKHILCLAGLSSPKRDFRRMWQAHLGGVWLPAHSEEQNFSSWCCSSFAASPFSAALPTCPAVGAVTPRAEIVGKAHPSAGWIWDLLFHCTLVFPDHGRGGEAGIWLLEEKQQPQYIEAWESLWWNVWGTKTLLYFFVLPDLLH